MFCSFGDFANVSLHLSRVLIHESTYLCHYCMMPARSFWLGLCSFGGLSWSGLFGPWSAIKSAASASRCGSCLGLVLSRSSYLRVFVGGLALRCLLDLVYQVSMSSLYIIFCDASFFHIPFQHCLVSNLGRLGCVLLLPCQWEYTLPGSVGNNLFICLASISLFYPFDSGSQGLEC